MRVMNDEQRKLLAQLQNLVHGDPVLLERVLRILSSLGWGRAEQSHEHLLDSSGERVTDLDKLLKLLDEEVHRYMEQEHQAQREQIKV